MVTILQPERPILAADDTLRVTYNGSYGVLRYDKAKVENTIEIVTGPLPHAKFVWDGKDELGGMEKGDSRLVPFDLVRVFFGDPRSVQNKQQRQEDRRGNVGDIAPREVEVHRLSVLYGLYDSEASELARFVPDCSIETADGVAIVTVADDPRGETVYGHYESEDDIHDTATLLTKMKAQIKALEEQAKAEAKTGRRNDGADVKTDGPPQPA